MTEQELRAIVRDAVARRLGQSLVPGSGSRVREESRVPGPADDRRSTIDDRRRDVSHAVYLSLVNIGGECVIEPSVPCNHCNYCKSHGH